MMNGLDRVMHLSKFVTTAARHKGGQGIAMEMSCVFTFVLLLIGGGGGGVGNTRFVKRQCKENITDCRGNNRWFYQLAVPHSAVF